MEYVLTLLALSCLLLLVRNELVYNCYRRKLEEMRAAIGQELFWRLHDELEATSYEARLLDLRKWTYKQFFPEDEA